MDGIQSQMRDKMDDIVIFANIKINSSYKHAMHYIMTRDLRLL